MSNLSILLEYGIDIPDSDLVERNPKDQKKEKWFFQEVLFKKI